MYNRAMHNSQPFNRISPAISKMASASMARLRELPEETVIPQEINIVVNIVYNEVQSKLTDVEPDSLAHPNKSVVEKIFDAAIRLLGDVGAALVVAALKAWLGL